MVALVVELPEGVGKTLSVDPSLFDQQVENYGVANMKVLPFPKVEKAQAVDSALEISAAGPHLDLNKLKLGSSNMVDASKQSG